MKRILCFVAAAALLLMTSSCGVLNSSNASSLANTAVGALSSITGNAQSAGRTSGAALKDLYTQYKNGGNKLDLSNGTTLANLASLITGISGLKNTTDKNAFYTDFASGLILGSTSLVNSNNANSILNTLTSMSNLDLSQITGAAAKAATGAAAAALNTNSGNVASALGSLSSIFSLFK